MADKLLLGYWGIRGRAQALRYYLEYLGLPYEEKRYQKPEEWFGEVAQAPLNTQVLVNLPYIKDGDKWVFESGALYVYLAHKANRVDLLGYLFTPEEQVALAQSNGLHQDILIAFFALLNFTEEQYVAKKDEHFKKDIAWLIEKLNGFLANKKWITGNNLTYVDFLFFEFEETLKAFNLDFFNSQANIVKHHEEFANIPQIKAYLASDKFIAAPFYPPGALRWWG